MTAEQLKRAAAEKAVDLVENGMKLGLGTGSTARHVLEVLAERLRRRELREIIGVPTSHDTARLAIELDIPLSTLDDTPELDLGIDGADEVDSELNLIKGLGGALLWEKIVAASCTRFIVVIDDSKLVQRLGTRGPLPVEVMPFGWSTQLKFLQKQGARALLRRNRDGSAFKTDGGHHIIDCAFSDGIEHPKELDTKLHLRPGIVETGLFLGMCSAVVVAGSKGAQVMERSVA